MKHTATALFGSVTNYEAPGSGRRKSRRPKAMRQAAVLRDRCTTCASLLPEGQGFQCPQCFHPMLCAEHVYECSSCGGHRCKMHIVMLLLPPEDTPGFLCLSCEGMAFLSTCAELLSAARISTAASKERE